MPNTKIVATLGPASESPDVLRLLLKAGVDVFRLNFSHGTPVEHARRLRLLRRVAREPRFATVRAGLLIKDIVDVPAERYRALLDYESEAARLGYATLA